jgi:hypothetical protein
MLLNTFWLKSTNPGFLAEGSHCPNGREVLSCAGPRLGEREEGEGRTRKKKKERQKRKKKEERIALLAQIALACIKPDTPMNLG